ncbi:Uncharacterized damage-inducible protein DinB (forms a four-helix bundle) [Paracoccus isoporae]|uniref:Uncharacterized damage-inducible protein DinB (Forms a four-helix bundle) n=1 Tax=Paracoccus isoporae TaxID=591205 RepID=A0A1G6XWZ4_9RHOB|nr:DinB family protein [Paracoccus isoporae]SDD81896.1 Uncharacterized damage-inducible protein DinB (forms a four-helix bundle) [Paracoccus isoporae]
MIDTGYAIQMARYNLWQNDGMLDAAGGLDPAERQRDRGAFFGSIERTFSHLWWGDMMWFSRFSDWPKPEAPMSGSADLIRDWDRFAIARRELDRRILAWARDLSADWLGGDLNWWSASNGQHFRQPTWILVTHFFNHQTHHRGQIHAMLTAAGAQHALTDLAFMPAPYDAM